MAPFFETKSQAWVFLGMIYLGLGLGVIYDALGLLRKTEKKGFIAGADLIFFLLAGGTLTMALVMTGQDGLRLYSLLGLACGGLLYVLGLRRLVLGIAAFMGKRVVKPAQAAMARYKEKKERRKLARAGRKQGKGGEYVRK